MAERIWNPEELNVRMAEAVRDLQAPWNTRGRFDRQVLGSIELAFLRGAQHVIPPVIRQDLERIVTALDDPARTDEERCQDARRHIRRLLDEEIVISSAAPVEEPSSPRDPHTTEDPQ